MSNPTGIKPVTFVTIEQVQERFARASRTSVYKDVRDGVLPRPVKHGGRNLWVKSEVDEAARRLVRARDAQAVPA